MTIFLTVICIYLWLFGAVIAWTADEDMDGTNIIDLIILLLWPFTYMGTLIYMLFTPTQRR